MNYDQLKLFPNQLTQNDPTECVALLVTDLAGNWYGKAFDPDFTYAASLKLMGLAPNVAGLDPIAGMQSAILGLLPASDETFTALSNGELYVANLQNYTPQQIKDAAQFQMPWFNTISDGSPTPFQLIKSWMDTNKRGCGMAMTWYQSFMNPESNGVLLAPSGGTTNHMVGVYSNDDMPNCLTLKPWLGKTWGNGGYGYLEEQYVNQVCQGAYGFTTGLHTLMVMAIYATRFPGVPISTLLSAI